MNQMGVLLLLCYLMCYFIYKLTFSVCAWWWSCNSLHGSRWWYRWCRWRL